MLKILILICPIALDHIACDQTNAIDVVRPREMQHSAQMCGMMGQAMLAPTALVPDPTKAYEKVVCVREPATSTEAAR